MPPSLVGGLIALAAASAVACGGEHGPVEVELRMALHECQPDTQVCGTEHRTSGVVAESGEPVPDDIATEAESLILFADFETPTGALAILEIAVGDSGEPNVRYREIFGGRVSFKGDVVRQNIQLTPLRGDVLALTGDFEFVAIDPEQPEGFEERHVFFGEVTPRPYATPAAAGATPHVPSSPNRPRPDEVPKVRDPPEEDPDTWRRDRGEVDVDVVIVDGGGCDDPYETSGGGCDGGSSGGGCDAPSSGSGGGCEGDTVDAGGCDGGSSGGCEGDTIDAGGCDSCSVTRPNIRARRRALASMWRLAWPMILVALWNRRARRRG